MKTDGIVMGMMGGYMFVDSLHSAHQFRNWSNHSDNVLTE